MVHGCLGLGPLLEYCAAAEAQQQGQQQQGQQGLQGKEQQAGEQAAWEGPLALQRRFPLPLLPRAIEWLRQRQAQHAAPAAPGSSAQQAQPQP